MSRNTIFGLTLILGLGLIDPQPGRAQIRRPDAPEISVLYWYNMTNPQGTIQFKVYDSVYPQGPVRDWVSKNKINDINSDLRGCPFDAPFRIQLSRYPGYRNGTMTKEEIVQAVKEQIKKTLPPPQTPIRSIRSVDVTRRPSAQPKAARGATGFTYNPSAPSIVGTWHQKSNPDSLLVINGNQVSWMNQYFGTFTQSGNTVRAQLRQQSIPDAYVTMDGNLQGKTLHAKMSRSYNTTYGRKTDDFGEYDFEK
jgi:hypothetical protein